MDFLQILIWETVDAHFHINGHYSQLEMLYFFVSKCKQDDWPISFVTLRSIIFFCCGWTPIMNMLLLKMFNHWSSILENLPNDTFFRSRMNVKIMCEFWPKLILTHYWFAVPIASSPNAERIRVFARKPTIRPTLQNWLTTESWDWSMNFLALAVVLLTPNTIPPQFSQVNLKCNFNHLFNLLCGTKIFSLHCT